MIAPDFEAQTLHKLFLFNLENICKRRRFNLIDVMFKDTGVILFIHLIHVHAHI